MALDRIHGEIVFFCDGPGCHEDLATGERDIHEANVVRRDAGWIARQQRGEWQHYCSAYCDMGFD